MKKNFTDPILFADYSDPDAIRLGNLYVMTASSFNYTPGLPVLLSYDLVTWTLWDHAVENLGKGFEKPRHSQGVWAPAIRYFDHRLHIYYGMPDEGLFVVRSSEILEEDIRCFEDFHPDWDAPVCVLPGKGLIDPCPFEDEDGRRFLIHGYAKSRIGFKSVLGIFELSKDGREAVSEDKFLFNGNLVDASMRENNALQFRGGVGEKPDEKTAPAVTVEGPKVMKRDGWYYIFAPAGGVTFGHQLCIRSRELYGPYECKVVLHQGDTLINGPHQGALVETVHGEEFFLHFQDLGPYGRICHLQPVTWKDGWPVFGVEDENGIGTPVSSFEMEMGEEPKAAEPAFTDGAAEPADRKNNTYEGGIASEASYHSLIDETGKLDLHWQWMGDHREEFSEIVDSTEDGSDACKKIRRLRLNALNPTGAANPVLWNCSNVLTRKLDRPEFTFDLELDIRDLRPGDRSGLMMTGGQYCFLECRKTKEEKLILCLGESLGGDKDKSEQVKELCTLPDMTKSVTFRMDYRLNGKVSTFQNVKDEKPVTVFSYSTDGMKYATAGDPFAPKDHTWVGAKIGLYAVSGIGSEIGPASVQQKKTDLGSVLIKRIGIC